jgi:hypothetical protein
MRIRRILEELSDPVAMNLSHPAERPLFRPNQIVCLSDRHLESAASGQLPILVYGEVVQYVADRGLCWVRPLAMAQVDPQVNSNWPSHWPNHWPEGPIGDPNWQDMGGPGWIFYDLREGSDLLLPAAFFQEALDTEVLPLMARLYQAEEKVAPPEALQAALQVARQQLNAFVRQICQAHPQLFVDARPLPKLLE